MLVAVDACAEMQQLRVDRPHACSHDRMVQEHTSRAPRNLGSAEVRPRTAAAAGQCAPCVLRLQLLFGRTAGIHRYVCASRRGIDN